MTTREQGQTPETFAMLTLQSKMLHKFQPQDESPRWGTNLEIPAFLLKDCDRDDDEPDQYGRGDE